MAVQPEAQFLCDQSSMPAGPKTDRLRGIHALFLACTLVLIPALAYPLWGIQFSFPHLWFAFVLGGFVMGLLSSRFKRPSFRLPFRDVMLLVARSCAVLTVGAVVLHPYTLSGYEQLHSYISPFDFTAWSFAMLDLAIIAILPFGALLLREKPPQRSWLVTLVVGAIIFLTVRIGLAATPLLPFQRLTDLAILPLPACLFINAALYVVLTRRLATSHGPRLMLLWDSVPLLAWFGLLAWLGDLDSLRGVLAGKSWFILTYPPLDMTIWGAFILSFGLAHLLFVRALGFAPATTLAPFMNLKTVFLIFLAGGLSQWLYPFDQQDLYFGSYHAVSGYPFDPLLRGALFIPTFDLDTANRAYALTEFLTIPTIIPAAIILFLLLVLYWRERVAVRREQSRTQQDP